MKSEADFDGFELSEEQVNMLLDRVDMASAGFEDQQQDQDHPGVYKIEDMKAELSLSNSHFVKYRMHEGKHIKTWQCAICEFSKMASC